ncbi:MAG: phage major capsid protein [Thermodesulfobacteriota bacterium]
MKKLKTGKLYRELTLDRGAVNEEDRTVGLSFSSEEPYDRWFGTEILDHGKKSVRLDRLKSTGPFLLNHDTSKQIGVVEDVTLGADRTGRAVVRFGKSALAEEIYNDVKDGIRKSVSVGYQIHRMVLEEEQEGHETYRAVDWEPLEVSLVPVPADITVGVGRGKEDSTHETIIETREVKEMKTCNHCKRSLTEGETCDCQTRKAPPASAVTPNIEEIRAEERKTERQRVSEISALGKLHKMDDLAAEHIGKGTTLDEFRAEVLAKLGKLKPVDTTPDIGMTEREAKSFSLLRALNALANPTDRSAQEAAAFEFDASGAVSKKLGRAARGVFVPYEVQKRDLTVGTATAGGNTVATDLLSTNFIDLLRNRMKVFGLGAQVLDGLVGNIAIPSQTGGATGYWVAENAAPTESQRTVGQVTMSPKTVGAFTDISRLLLLQSSIGVEGFVQADLAMVLALAIDLAAINGSGAANQPLGILGTTGIGDVAGGTNGAAPTYANMVELETDVAASNADVDGMAILSTPEMRGKLKQTQRFGSTDTPVWEPNNTVNGYRAEVSNQVPKTLTKGTSTDCHAIIFGNWRDLIVGQWGALDVLVDPYTGGAAGTVRVRVLQSMDIAVRHAASFSAMQDARNI